MWFDPKTGKSFLLHSHIREAFSTSSLPPAITDDVIRNLGLFPLVEDAPPTIDYTKRLHKMPPTLVGNVWTVRWEVSDLSPDEILQKTLAEKERVRNLRNVKLSATDWTQLSDSVLPQMQREAWATYRQALRDITSQQGFPFDINWPVEPT